LRKLVWSDGFDYTGTPDPSKWTLQTGGHGWGNNEPQFYTDRTTPDQANAWVSDGKLAVRLRREDYCGKPYTSARLSSNFAWQYGRLDVSAKLPGGLGTWPAIWMLGSSVRSGTGWPDCGEIDVMEHVGRAQDIVHFSLHSGLYNHKNDTHLTQTRLFPGVSEGFHCYSLDWEEDRLTFLFDGEKAAEWRKGDGGRGADIAAWPFNAPFFLIINLAFGGNFGGDPDDNCLPQDLEIQYVRVAQ
jgi:beta-glucanase (GH16 family)